MNIIRRILLASAPALLAGCAAYPVAPNYYTGSYDYYGPAYYRPLPMYVVPPVHHRPPGVSGHHHSGSRSRGLGHGHGHRHR